MEETSKKAFEITKNVTENTEDTLANVHSGGEVGELKAEIKQLKNENITLAFDLNYYKAILDGSWPQAIEILTRAIKKAKALTQGE